MAKKNIYGGCPRHPDQPYVKCFQYLWEQAKESTATLISGFDERGNYNYQRPERIPIVEYHYGTQ